MGKVTILQQRPRVQTVKDLAPRAREDGKIKIGRKTVQKDGSGEAKLGAPQKLDHFVVTTMVRDADGNFARDDAYHQVVGDKPRTLPVRLLFDEPEANLQTRYAAYQGRKLWCSGDGETAFREGQGQRKCPCPNRQPGYEPTKDQGPACKLNARLVVQLETGRIGGVYVFRTTSYNSVTRLLQSMERLRTITGGRLADIPLQLAGILQRIEQKNGKGNTHFVVGLDFVGSVEELRAKALQAEGADQVYAQARQTFQARMQELIEEPVVGTDEDADIADEFHADSVAAAEGRTLGPAERDIRAEAFLREVEAATADLDVDRLRRLFDDGADLPWEVREEAAIGFADVPGTEPKDPKASSWVAKQVDRAAEQGGDAWRAIRKAFLEHPMLAAGDARLWALGMAAKRRQEQGRQGHAQAAQP